jgi:hypothetical protein
MRTPQGYFRVGTPVRPPLTDLTNLTADAVGEPHVDAGARPRRPRPRRTTAT